MFNIKDLHASRPTNDTHDTTFLLCICTWLIVNSHLKMFHPYSWMGFDGLLANSLFYFLSGYGIQRSLDSRATPFIPFILRRMKRLYPSVIIVTTFFVITGIHNFYFQDILQVFKFFIWPTPYTYIGMIVIYYCFLWIFSHFRSKYMVISMIFSLISFFTIVYYDLDRISDIGSLTLGNLPATLWFSYFWVATAMGALFSRANIQSISNISRIVICCIFVGMYLIIKFIIVVLKINIWIYPILFIIVLLICFASAATFCDRDFNRRIRAIPILGAFFALSAGLSLQIYLVHEPLVHVPILMNIMWPLNILILASISLIGAVAVGFLVKPISVENRETPR